jgi:diguanylate cyclase (GGDEF)-like protein/PAS domain S-box-containing protein
VRASPNRKRTNPSAMVLGMTDNRGVHPQKSEIEIANATLDSIAEAVLRTDERGNVTYLNRIAEQMTGWNREEALGQAVTEVLQIIDRVTREPVGDDVGTVRVKDRTPGVVSNCVNCILVRRDGFEIEIENRVTIIYGNGGLIRGAVASFHDVSASQARSLRMSHLAQHDSLTNLPNRVLFSDRVTQAIALADRQHKSLAIMFVDLDHFKSINDSLGHAVGDELLQSVAGRLVTCVRRADTVCRFGGDEFVVLLSQIEHAEDAAFSAQKMLRALAAPYMIHGKSIDISVTVGSSSCPTDGRDVETLIKKADVAMYKAKQRGRNNYQCFRPEMQAQAAERQLLEEDLRYALGRNEFLLHYQPKFNLETGQITGAEALIRWSHPLRGSIYPGQFVPIAEECGLILTIGRWVLLQACKQARLWRDSGLGIIPVAVNVSSAEFSAKDFISGVRAVLIATGVEPGNLELELTESVLMQDAESTVRTLEALKAMGVRLSIDDFGTGYSSFTYLRRFPVDALKLHQSFVHEITSDPGDATIVSAMINIGKSLNQRVIAEGVETHEQLSFLRHHGCTEGQDYYLGRPAAPDDLAKLYAAAATAGVSY